MLFFSDFAAALRKFGFNRSCPVVVHASLSAFGQVQGGAEAAAEALAQTFETVIAPAFTYKTMVVPETGPSDNAIRYGSGRDTNRMAEFFHPDMPVDRMIGAIPEALRRRRKSMRSAHPILSFSGTGRQAREILAAQTLENPLAPIEQTAARGGAVLLFGVGSTVNTSIHYAERLAGRRGFTRWALTPEGVVECPGFPGCSDGFGALDRDLAGAVEMVKLGRGEIRMIALDAVIKAVGARLSRDPVDLLCGREECLRCGSTRAQAMKYS